MPEASDFSDLIRRVRSGDEAAASELVQRYEPAIRRAVRIRLSDCAWRCAFDSMDICQSVMASSSCRPALGQYELDTPDQLLKLLARMARHKLADQVDKELAAACRDNRRVADGGAEERAIATARSSPSREIAPASCSRKCGAACRPRKNSCSNCGTRVPGLGGHRRSARRQCRSPAQTPGPRHRPHRSRTRSG